MSRMIRSGSCLLALVLCLLAVNSSVLASPSGLNNIPTTDVPLRNTIIMQTWLNLAANMDIEQYVGFKTSLLLDGLEFGVDWKAYGETHGHATLQAKYSHDIIKGWWQGAVGFANLSEDWRHNGKVFPYVVTAVDLRLVRLHLGYAPQPHNEAFFAGIDRTIPFLNRNLQLKGDAIHINDKNDVLFSAGFLYDLNPIDPEGDGPASDVLKFLTNIVKNVVLEGWVSMPSTGEQEVYTLKLNYVFKF